MTKNHKHTHAQWSSRFGFILAAVGSAVGLGNIWKFPYMVGTSGGAAFLITYLFCIVLVGFPVMVAEWLIGRRGQQNASNSMRKVALESGRSSAWGWIGAMGIVSAFLILSFYSVIGGWAMSYIGQTAVGTFSGMDGKATGAFFEGFLANYPTLTVWHSIFMLITGLLIALGVANGIEKAAKILMPLLGICLVILVGYASMQPGFGQAINFLFNPDFSKITGEVFLAALGHAFFTLSIGMGIMLSYGSYLGQDVNLLKSAGIVVLMDTVFAIMAGLAIFPIVFTHGLEAGSGPGLIFVTLPIAFGNMNGGSIIGLVFFVLVAFAAITSSISLLEPVVEFLEERTPLSRKMSTLVAATVIWALGILALLSFNVLSDVKWFGLNIFDFLDYITSKIMMPLGGLGVIIFVGWFMNQKLVQEEVRLSGGMFTAWQILSRVIAPIGVIIVFIFSLIL